MNTNDKIKDLLRKAPNANVPNGLLEKLQKNITLPNSRKERLRIPNWFYPAGSQSLSLRRVAFAAVVILAVMLPLSYGAVKVVKKYVLKYDEHTFEYHDRSLRLIAGFLEQGCGDRGVNAATEGNENACSF